MKEYIISCSLIRGHTKWYVASMNQILWTVSQDTKVTTILNTGNKEVAV